MLTHGCREEKIQIIDRIALGPLRNGHGRCELAYQTLATSQKRHQGKKSNLEEGSYYKLQWSPPFGNQVAFANEGVIDLRCSESRILLSRRVLPGFHI